MEQQFIQIFFYLAATYLIDGVLISLFRRIKLADFIAHILTGVILGFSLTMLGSVFGDGSIELILKNEFIRFIAYVGLLLFVMHLGFNFDMKFFKMNSEKHVFLYTSILVLISMVLLGGLGYLGLFEKNIIPSFLFFIAFLGINIGSVLFRNFPVPPGLKKPFTLLLRIAITLDLLVIILFSCFQLYAHYANSGLTNFKIELLSWLILAIFALLSFLPAKIEQISRWMYHITGEFAMLLKLGIFFLFIYAGLKVGISILLLGIWAGLLFRSLAGSTQFEAQQKFFPIASYLYILPFVEVGRFLVMEWQSTATFWPHLSYILLTLVVISLLYSLIMVFQEQHALIFGLGVFPRGELTILVLWLLKELSFSQVVFPKSVIIISIIAVIITSLLGTLLGKILFIHPAEFKNPTV